MDFLGLARHKDQLKRITEIARVLGHYGLAEWVHKIPSREIRDLLASPETQSLGKRPWEERVRLAMTDLGTTFVKLGQALSTRPDLVGPELAMELRKLQSETPADPPEVVIGVIQSEMGKPPGELFSEFEPVAFASASIGQVHRARLHNGKAVVIKVQHDGIEEKIRPDLDLLLALAQVVEKYIPASRAYQPTTTVTDFRRTLLHELDFQAERRNLQQFAHNFAREPAVHIPEVYPECSGRRVLTMEMLNGIPGSKQKELHESGADLNEFAHRAAQMYLDMIFRDGFYHADPHPGNYIMLPGNVVGVLDFGMVGRIDDSLRENLEDILIALSNGDADGLTELFLQSASPPPDINEAAFRADVSDYLAEYAYQSVKDINLGGALDELTAIIRRHCLILPQGMALLLKTLIMLEGSARELSPRFNLMELVVPYKSRMIRDRFKPRRWINKFRRVYRDVDHLITNGPRDLAKFLDQIRAGKVVVQLEHQHLQAAVNRLVIGILTGALFLGSSQLWSQNISPLLFGVSVPGAMGCLLALAMGGLLLRVISRQKE